MGRPTRNDSAGNWHHAMNRGGRHGAIFIDDDDRERFLRLLGGIRNRFSVTTHAYCLMDNHYHLLLHCPSARLSEAMQYLSGCYTRSFNERHLFDGPLFKGRFASRDITSDTQLLDVSRYIHRNPLDIGAHVALGEYRWSSFGAYLGKSLPPAWLETSFLGGIVGSPRSYHSFVETRRPADETTTIPSAPPASDSTSPPNRKIPTLEDVENSAACSSGCAVEDLLVSQARATNLPRLLAIVVAIDDFSIDPVQIAKRFGISRSGLRSAIARARKLALPEGPLYHLRQDTVKRVESNCLAGIALETLDWGRAWRVSG